MPAKVPVSQLQGSVCHEEAIDARGFCNKAWVMPFWRWTEDVKERS